MAMPSGFRRDLYCYLCMWARVYADKPGATWLYIVNCEHKTYGKGCFA